MQCLRAWRANMDIQYITNSYSCAVYISSYITKGQRGMSELLKVASEEARLSCSNIREQVRVIGNKFLNNVEISAQEAVYLLLQIPRESHLEAQYSLTQAHQKNECDC